MNSFFYCFRTVNIQKLTLKLIALLFVFNINSIDVFGQDQFDKSKYTNRANASGFTENKGQLADVNGSAVPYVYFRTSQRNVDFLITKFGLSYTFFDPIDEPAVTSDKKLGESPKPITYNYARTLVYLENASILPENIVKEDPTNEAYANYYKPHCPQGIFGVKSYGKVTIKEVYPGIDWILYSTSGGIKYDFVIHPGADPNQIKIKYEGAADLASNNEGGSVTIKNTLGEIREGALLSYQKESKKQVASKFLVSDNKLSFWLGNYDKNETLVIDPPVSWGTYFGTAATAGLPGGLGLDIAADADEVFVTGHSNDLPILAWDPSSLGAGNTTYNVGTLVGLTDAYLARFNHGGAQSWTTYVGSSGLDYGWSVAIDPVTNHIAIVGEMQASNFPTKNLAGAFNFTDYKAYCGFITEFDNNGILYWSTFYGEPNTGEAGATTICRTAQFDGNGNFFVGGYTLSKNLTLNNGGGVPFYKGTHSDASDIVIDRQWDAFLLKFDNATRAMSWGTLWGGALSDVVNSINFDDNNNLLVVGNTLSNDLGTSSQLYNAGGATYYDASNSLMDAFVLKFNTSLQMTWGTLFGDESGNETGYDVAADRSHNIYIVGYSEGGATFPYKDLGSGAYYKGSSSGYKEAYIARFSSTGVQDWGTLYGGGGTSANTGDDWFMGVVTSSTSQVYVYGTTYSSTFPTQNAYQTTHGSTGVSRQDFCVVGFNQNGVRKFSSYIGGNANDYAYEGAIALYPGTDCFYFTGGSNSTNAPTVDPGGGAYYQNTKAATGYETVIYRWCTALGASVTSSSNNTCSGGTAGSATALAFDGAGGYTYSWNPSGQTTATATGLGAGTYTVTITDASTATSTVTVQITSPSAVTASVSSSNNVSCNGAGDGDATASGGGGTPNYSYSWSTGQTVATATGLSPSTYTVTVTDANSCTKTATVVITQPSALTASVGSVTNVLCNGGSTGAATATASSTGTGPYTYSWSNTKTTASVTGLSAATYTVEITDANLCTKTATVQITQPAAALAASVSASTNVACNGASTGDATVSASDGTAGYTYSWSTTPSQTAATATGLSATTYTVKVTDANSCTKTATIVITQPSVLAASVSSSTNVDCFGNNSGAATVSASNGAGTYTYSWSAGGQTTATATGLTGTATYTVTVTDANLCTKTTTVQITQPAAALSASVSSSTNVLCFGNNTGNATVSASNGTATYSYLWSNGATTATATGLTGTATYTVTVTDANLCTKTATVQITQPAAALSATISSSTDVGCNGASTGQATVSAADGTAGYTYSWNTTPSQTTTTATGLSATTYTVEVTDANSCTKTVSVTLTQPAAALSASISSSTNVACFGDNSGEATVSASNGTAAYSYSWSAGGQTTATATGLTGTSTYTVTVTDANLCTKSATIQITQPAAALGASIASSTNVDCFGNNSGSATVSASNGTAGYTYLWSSGAQTTATATGLTGTATYTVTVTDANLCTKSTTVQITQPAAALDASIASSTNVACFGNNTGDATVLASNGTAGYTYSWSAGGQTTTTATGLTGTATYTVTVTDANLCTKTTTVQITQPANGLTAAITASTNVDCRNNATGDATVSASDGTAGYTYSWSTSPSQTAATATALTAGSYTVTVTDANLCTTSTTVSITQPAGILGGVIDSPTHVACYGGNTGTAILLPGGGTPAYSYSWSTSPSQTTKDATGLEAGTYTVTITDQHNCSATVTTIIVQPAAPLSALASQTTSVDCVGNNTGEAGVVASGGTTNYTYSWSNGVTGNSATSISNVAAGVYTVTVSDMHACTTSATVEVTQPSAVLNSNISTNSDVLCFGGNTGSATASASGGTSSYSYSWSNGTLTDVNNNLNQGTYIVTVTDNRGCTTTRSVVITEPTVLAFSSPTINDAHCGQTDGGASINISGGVSAYNYLWSNGSTLNSITNVGNGAYTVQVTDANGCTLSTAVTVSNLDGPSLALQGSVTNVLCHGDLTGAATVAGSGGTSPYSYSWNNGTTTTMASNLAGGVTYTVTITDATTCTNQIQVIITQPSAALSASITNVGNVNCYGNSTGSVTANVTGGTTNYSYLWNNGATTLSLSNVISGAYTLTVTDANNCSSTVTTSITQPQDSLDLQLTSFADISCFGGTDGWIKTTSSGGTTAYTYSWVGTGAYSSTAPDSIGGLKAGIYTVTLTDAGGCTKSIVKALKNPLPMDGGSAVVTQAIDCKGNLGKAAVGGAAQIGGTSPYTYSWSNGDTTVVADSLIAGTYHVTIIDAKGCTKSLPVTLTEPDSLKATASKSSDINCYGGVSTASVNVIGGTTGYSYSWSNTQTTSVITNIPAGNYVVTVTDAKNCSTTSSVLITQPNDSLKIGADSLFNVKCKGDLTGYASVHAYEGTGPYTYSWSNNDTDSVISGVAGGIYTVVVTDGNGCTRSTLITISQPANSIGVTIPDHTHVLCYGQATGSISAVGNGTPPYTYSWSNGQTGNSNALNGIVAGVYTVTVTDKNNCTASTSDTINQPSAPLSVILSSAGVPCYGGITNVSASATGGTPLYTYTWNTSATQQSISGVYAGSYSLTVHDQYGCTATANLNITQPSNSLSVTAATSSDNNCYGDANGSANVTTQGGTPSYAYSWNTGATTSSISNLVAGEYVVTVIDSNKCSGTDTVYVLQPTAALDVTLLVTDPNCTYSSDAGIVATVTGGTTAYNYSWSNNSTASSITGIAAGTYTLLVTDSKGCTIVKSATINVPSDPANASFTTDITSGVAPITVNFTNTSTGNVSNYVWNFGDLSPVENGVNAAHTYTNGGEYHVTLVVVNSKGCSDTADVFVYAYNIPNVFTPNGDGKNDTFFVINEGMEDVECQIYDRWGLLIYEYAGIHGYWDGRTLSGSLATDGTYYYLVNIKVKDGKEHKHQGYIQLIR